MKLGAGPLTLVLIVAVALFTVPLAADAQQAGRSVRVGYLSPRAGPTHLDEAFRQTLRELGWTEGQNLVIEHRWASGRRDRLTEFARELARTKVDVIFAPVSQAAEAAMKATRTVPIVFATAGDPVASGLAASLGRPGGNATGVSSLPGEGFVGKQLQLLKETLPASSRFAVLWNSTNPSHAEQVRQAEVVAATLRIRVQALEVSAPIAFEAAFDALTRERADLLFVLADPMFFEHRTQLADQTAKSRVPALYGLREHTEAGGLMSYGPSFPDLYRRAALYVDKILKGSKPAELPIEQPTMFELVINLKTAKALGLTIPPSLLLRADQVIE
jgi:putative ABC transport system substrate-binding protein